MNTHSDVINSMWIGEDLSHLERLCIESFLKQGHRFCLWIYGPLISPLPEGVELMNANEIIPENRVFAYRNRNTFGHGKGSYAGFSDIFRYKLLYEKGGWWVDMDISCLRKFNWNQEYFFRDHHALNVVGNVMKCPKGSAVMLACYNEAMAEVDEHNTDWHKPIEILNRNIYKYGLESFIVSEVSNHDIWEETEQWIWHDRRIPENFYFIHWQNEEWRNRNISKNEFRFNSSLGKLMIQNGIIQGPRNIKEKVSNFIRFSALCINLKILGVIE